MLARNPLFLRDSELDRSIELLLLVERVLMGRSGPVLGQLGLTEAEFRLLWLVHRHPDRTMAQLGTVLGLPKQSMSRHVRQLVDRGYIVLAERATDRRKRVLTLTEVAHRAIAELAELHRRELRRAFLAAGPEAVAGFQRVLTELLETEARRLAGRSAA